MLTDSGYRKKINNLSLCANTLVYIIDENGNKRAFFSSFKKEKINIIDKNEIYEFLIDQSKNSIVYFCRRHYHIFSVRGKKLLIEKKLKYIKSSKLLGLGIPISLLCIAFLFVIPLFFSYKERNKIL